MREIKFSHHYKKLWGQSRATLLACRMIKYDERYDFSLKEYDTKTRNGDYYALKDGTYLQLVFIGEKHIPFCTLRTPYNKHGNKKEYYENLIGQTFQIVISERG